MIADPRGRFERLLRLLLTLGAVATALIALWLYLVLLVLPDRNPGRVALWGRVAAAFLLYAGATFAFVSRGGRPAWLGAIVVALSLGAVAFGGYAVASMVRAEAGGGHFEGYLLLMGALLAGHGLCGLGYAALRALNAGRA